MKRLMKLFSLLLAVICTLAISCERHEFDGPNGTKQLHEAHGSHAAHGSHDNKHHGSESKSAHAPKDEHHAPKAETHSAH